MKMKHDNIEATQQKCINTESSSDFEFPDRIVHPEEYEEETSTMHTGMDLTNKLPSENHA